MLEAVTATRLAVPRLAVVDLPRDIARYEAAEIQRLLDRLVRTF